MEKTVEFKIQRRQGQICLISEKGLEIFSDQSQLVLTFGGEGNEKPFSYDNPIVPTGFTHVEGEWYDGFVVEDIQGNQFVWIPVGMLSHSGTIGGKTKQQFGVRNFLDDNFKDDEFHQEMDVNIKRQSQSVKKYGGFYIARYSMSRISSMPCSRKGEIPWTDISYEEAQWQAERMANLFAWQGVSAHIPSGAEYDTVLQWLIDSGEKSFRQVAKDSEDWGNYYTKKIARTGSRNKYRTNNIYDLAGNVVEWTSEEYSCFARVQRGGGFNFKGCDFPAAYRDYPREGDDYNTYGFRVALYLE